MLREATATLVRREDYAPPAFFIRSVELTFDLDPAKTIVGSRLRIERNPAMPRGALRLHGEELTLLRCLADGQSVSFRHEGGDLVIDNPPESDAFTLELRNTCAPEKNLALSGLYTSGGGFFTQCEAEGFRRITYYLDRPDVMAVYTVTLRADRARYPVLLSNGNLVEEGRLENGRHFAKWHDPHPKPSYLFALVAGNLVAREQRIRSRSGRDHLLQVYVRPGDLEKTEHAMNSLVASVAWDEARFGLSLDLDRYMVVAVEDYNGGAMENKGLNLFNTKYVLGSPASATDADFAGIESVIAHEYFHNWTGNRVTCRDWFQLSLKEGLTVYRDQEFSADMAGAVSPSGRAVQRIKEVRRLRSMQYPEDAGPMAHSVRPDAYLEIQNFYTPTVYEKGAEVVRMMATLVGREGFARGLALYFRRHDGQAVTCDDFAQAIADANPGSELGVRLEAFKRWYGQAGTPRVSARGHWDAAAQTYTLTLAQGCPPTPGQPEKQPFVIPVLTALLSPAGHVLAPERLLVLEQAEQAFVFEGIGEAPVPSLLRGLSAPVKLDDGLADPDRLALLAHDTDAFNRFEAGQRLMLDRLLTAVREGGEPQLDDRLAEALRRVLRDPGLDAQFKALVLTAPDEDYIAEQLAEVDPQRIHAVRESWRARVAARLHADWIWAFEQHQVREGYRPTVAQSGRRSLANLALSHLVLHAVQHGDEVWPGRAYQRFKDAGNMTERLGAILALVDAQSPLAAPAIERFHAMANGDALVLDKWFMLQATAPEPLGERAGSAFMRARALLHHPDFSMKNPNRVRSLLFGLAGSNPAAFHRTDAAGYVLWVERLLELDGHNPQLAARFARMLDRWRSLAEPWRSSAREAIARVAARPDLSNDVREVVTRSLADEAGA